MRAGGSRPNGNRGALSPAGRPGGRLTGDGEGDLRPSLACQRVTERPQDTKAAGGLCAHAEGSARGLSSSELGGGGAAKETVRPG